MPRTAMAATPTPTPTLVPVLELLFVELSLGVLGVTGISEGPDSTVALGASVVLEPLAEVTDEGVYLIHVDISVGSVDIVW